MNDSIQSDGSLILTGSGDSLTACVPEDGVLMGVVTGGTNPYSWRRIYFLKDGKLDTFPFNSEFVGSSGPWANVERYPDDPTCLPAWELSGNRYVLPGTLIRLQPRFLNYATDGRSLEWFFSARDTPIYANVFLDQVNYSILAADVGAYDTTIQLADAIGHFPERNGFRIFIGDAPPFSLSSGEVMEVVSGAGTNTWVVKRDIIFPSDPPWPTYPLSGVDKYVYMYDSGGWNEMRPSPSFWGEWQARITPGLVDPIPLRRGTAICEPVRDINQMGGGNFLIWRKDRDGPGFDTLAQTINRTTTSILGLDSGSFPQRIPHMVRIENEYLKVFPASTQDVATTSGSNALTTTNPDALTENMLIGGNGNIPGGATLTSVDPLTGAATMSSNATGTGSASTTFTPPSNSMSSVTTAGSATVNVASTASLFAGMIAAGNPNIPAGRIIASVLNSTSFLLNNGSGVGAGTANTDYGSSRLIKRGQYGSFATQHDAGSPIIEALAEWLCESGSPFGKGRSGKSGPSGFSGFSGARGPRGISGVAGADGGSGPRGWSGPVPFNVEGSGVSGPYIIEFQRPGLLLAGSTVTLNFGSGTQPVEALGLGGDSERPAHADHIHELDLLIGSESAGGTTLYHHLFDLEFNATSWDQSITGPMAADHQTVLLTLRYGASVMDIGPLANDGSTQQPARADHQHKFGNAVIIDTAFGTTNTGALVVDNFGNLDCKAGANSSGSTPTQIVISNGIITSITF